MAHGRDRIVQWIENSTVARMDDICVEFGVSPSTVRRALEVAGYFRSYNHNSSFYTLRNVPRFDRQGLWEYNEVRFSMVGTVKETVKALILNSPAGQTVEELEERLGVKVHNQLSALCRAQALRGFYEGRRVVYVSAERERGPEQELLRQRGSSRHARIAGTLDRPQGLDALTVIGILLAKIRLGKRDSTPKEIAARTTEEGVRVTTSEVRRVQDFYGLKKTAD